MRRLGVLAAAAAMDLAWGEPPERLHPVVWLGRLISVLQRRAPRGSAAVELAAGAGIVALCVGLTYALGAAIERILAASRRIPALIAFLAEAWLLKTTFSIRALFEAAADVQAPLEKGDLPGARTALRSLVSRPSQGLSEPQVAGAAIESLAENASDGVVAPVLAYLMLGLPWAMAYRAINTLDSMLGYRGSMEWQGKAAARLDDVTNLAPARLTAGLLLVAGGFLGRPVGRSLAALGADRGRAASPNAGWPMSAMAGALSVQLEKPGHYCLNPSGRQPTAGDIAEAARVTAAALLLGLLLATVVEGARRVATP